ncbi:MAG: hypothetical protein J5543_04850 [Bacteroidales bacterium]|nr:hypothetical protein [Bacteroidales bacterium]
MPSGTYLFAEIPVRIFSLYDEVQVMCADYRTEQEPEVIVTTTLEEIAEEDRLSDEQRELEGLPPYKYSTSYLETLTVYRKIALAFMQRNVLLMHGSVVAVDGEAYMFTALSGTGKSTHVRLWRKLFGQRAVMVNDDKPLVRIGEERPVVYGTPWDGKHRLSNNIAVPLKAIVILKRGEENEIHPITVQEAFPTLLQQSFRTEDPMVTIRTMQLLSQLAEHVGLYELHCNMNPEAAEVAYRGMNDEF